MMVDHVTRNNVITRTDAGYFLRLYDQKDGNAQMARSPENKNPCKNKLLHVLITILISIPISILPCILLPLLTLSFFNHLPNR